MLNRIKIFKFTALSAAIVSFLAACGGTGGADSPSTQAFFPAAEDEWEMVFNDEFDGDSLNRSVWDIQTGDGSDEGLERWGNNEEQWYTEDSVTVADGVLTITAAETGTSGQNVSAQNEEIPPGFPYTSGRIRTAGNFDFTYGRVEASVKAAPGQGLWSAFWMLPTDSPYTSWAAIGEVDIMEVVNADTTAERVFQTLHYGFPWPLNQQTGLDEIDDVSDPSGEFHVYAVEWSDREMRWYIDDVHYLTITRDTWYTYFYADQQTGYMAGEGGAPFDVPFHILLNLAVGGNLPGEVDPADIPTEMVVDYVRVYRCTYDEPDGTGCNSNADRSLDTPNAQEPWEDEFPLYTDGADALEWNLAGQTVERQLQVGSGWDNEGSLTWSEVPAEDPNRGTVIDVMTTNSGNISISAVDGEPTSLFGFGNNPNYWELHAGELKFDIYVDSANTDPESSIFIKMDSGYPAVGQKEYKVADLPADAWTTISVPVNDLLASRAEGLEPMNTGAIISFFVLEPTAAAHVQIDNIELACGHPANRGCGILPPGGAVEGDLVNVFIDAVDPVWTNGIGAWDDVYLQDYFNGSSANHVTWSIIDTGEEGHDEVIDVSFGTSGANGLLFIQSAAGVDLSTIASGNLVFDLRLEAGSTHGITYKVDCFFPCSTGDLELDLSETVRGEWNTYEIPVSSLVAAGLDISQVNSAIVIFPTWNQQAGVSFEIDNVRYEIPDGGPSGPPTFAGTWRMAPEAGSLGVGPAPLDVGWFACDEACVQERACYFDDDYVFGTDGTFDNVLGDETWIETWQGSASDSCGTPVSPHDGTAEATWEYDEAAGTLTVFGQGAYIGLPKAVNGEEISSPSAAPASITYTVESLGSDTAVLYIESGDSVFWNYKLTKTAEPPPPPPFVGTWRMAPEAGSLGVGPAPLDVGWFSCDAACVQERACYFDDDYVMSADGTFDNVLGDETWIEGWQGGSDACGTPVSPHDGTAEATWEYDEAAGTLTVFGQGAYIGLPKAVNGEEISSPSAAPSSITYEVESVDSDTAVLYIEAGDSVFWNYKLINTD